MLKLECPQCGAVGELDDAHANRSIRCPECKAVFDAPGGEAETRGGWRTRFRVSKTFQRSLSLFFGAFIILIPLAYLVQSPLLALHGAAAAGKMDPVSPNFARFLSWLLTGILSAITIHIVFQLLRGSRARVGDALVHGMRRAPAVLGVNFMVGVMIAVAAVPGVILLVAGYGDFELMNDGSFDGEIESPGLVLLGVGLGLAGFFFVFPGIACALPVVAVERIGVFGAISRSWGLAKGRRMAILGLGFLVVIAMFVLAIPFHLVIAVFVDPTKHEFAQQLIGVPFGALYTVVLSVLYHDLRVEREGISTESLTAVFE